MKRFITILLSFLFISFQTAKAEIGFGITGALHMLEADGTEITRNSGENNSGSHSEDALVPELFLETISDDGIALGISYIPTRDMGSKSRTDTNPTAADSGNDAGTYKAEAELDNVIQLYIDYPLTKNRTECNFLSLKLFFLCRPILCKYCQLYPQIFL